MQDRYTGDIGDFGKYGLLRSLTSPETGEPAPAGNRVVPDPGRESKPGRPAHRISPSGRTEETTLHRLRRGTLPGPSGTGRYRKPQRERGPRIRNPARVKRSTTAKRWHSTTRRGAGERQSGMLNGKNGKNGSHGTRQRWRKPKTATSSIPRPGQRAADGQRRTLHAPRR